MLAVFVVLFAICTAEAILAVESKLLSPYFIDFFIARLEWLLVGLVLTGCETELKFLQFAYSISQSAVL